jgi:uncharacterized protein (TIGR00161 family)
MQIELFKKPKGVTIIEGFPGFGFVSTIATEFLVEHTGAELIGRIKIEEIPPVIAIHKSAVVEPVGIFYSKKYNLVIVYALVPVSGYEWKLANMIQELAKQLNAKEIIGLEGVGGKENANNIYYLANKSDKFKKIKIERLNEGIVMGVTGALLLKKKLPVSCIFAETGMGLPDSRAAAKVIEVLDDYLNLKIDYKPLLKKAEEFESKVKGIISKSKNAVDQKDKKALDYFG